MTSARNLQVKVFVAALLFSVLSSVASLSSFGYRAETLILDSWFSLRYQLFGTQRIDPRLVMVGLDEHTIQALGKPMVLWQKDLAQLAAKIREGKPKVIGLDLLISPVIHKLDEEDPVRLRLQDEGFELGSQALENPPLVLVEVQAEDVLQEDSKMKAGASSPSEIVLQLLMDENNDSKLLGFANAPNDPDGVLRRCKLYFRTLNKTGEKKPSNLAFLLLEHATGEPVVSHQSDDETHLVWSKNEVPILFDQSFLVNYPGPVENTTDEPNDPSQALSFPIFSAQDIMTGAVSPELFTDKIVLIAPTATSLNDQKVVPGDPIYPGGAYHLSVLNMFLTEQFLSRSRPIWVVMSLLFCVIGVKIGRAGLIVQGVVASVAAPLLSFAAFTFLGSWLPVLFPLSSLVFSSLLGYAERLMTVEKDRAKVRSTFARMVSPQVMHHVLANYKSLRTGVRKEVTVLFSDINDFTPTCEQHSPEEVIEMLSTYFSDMVDVIMKYDGYLKQYVGDEIMVIFGAPDDSNDHATRAVLTALEMRDVLAKTKAQAQGKPGFYEVKIGINTGSVVVGKVGPESRWEYAAVGDDVNLGARVMSAAKSMGMDIGVSAATKTRFDLELEQKHNFPDKVKWISKGIQSFKGKISQMEVFGVERE